MKFVKPLWTLLALVLTVGIASSRVNAVPFDRQFIDSMVPHHESALVMARMAATKARLPQVKSLAHGIISDQQREIAQMKACRKAWFGSAKVPMSMTDDRGFILPGMMNMSNMQEMKMTMPGTMMGLPMKMEMDMGKLNRAKGRDFDKMFLAMMIPHHASAIVMAQEALDVSGRSQIRTLAHNIIDSQAKEIGEMRALHDRYFGKL